MGFRTIRAMAVIALLTVAGCHSLHERSCHKPGSYLGAKSVAPLVIPPGLDTPDRTNALRIPELNTPVPPPRAGREPCLDEPPPFNAPKATPAPQAGTAAPPVTAKPGG
jgi:uncharacterized lipoprotein